MEYAVFLSMSEEMPSGPVDLTLSELSNLSTSVH